MTETSSGLPGSEAARFSSDDRLLAMAAAHAAFRRDLESMARAGTATNLKDPARNASIMTGWEIFKNQLHQHHHHEDTFLWPRLRERMASSESALSILDDMDAEHGWIDPLLAAVDDSFERPDDGTVSGAIGELGTKLSFHLGHEEKDAMPMIGEAITDREWRKVVSAIRKESGIGAAAEFIPWLTDGASEEEAETILTIMPKPAKIIYRKVWKSRYDQVSHW